METKGFVRGGTKRLGGGLWVQGRGQPEEHAPRGRSTEAVSTGGEPQLEQLVGSCSCQAGQKINGYQGARGRRNASAASGGVGGSGGSSELRAPAKPVCRRLCTRGGGRQIIRLWRGDGGPGNRGQATPRAVHSRHSRQDIGDQCRTGPKSV